MRYLVICVLCFFAGQGATKNLMDLTSMVQRRYVESTAQGTLRIRSGKTPPSKQDKAPSSPPGSPPASSQFKSIITSSTALSKAKSSESPRASSSKEISPSLSKDSFSRDRSSSPPLSRSRSSSPSSRGSLTPGFSRSSSEMSLSSSTKSSPRQRKSLAPGSSYTDLMSLQRSPRRSLTSKKQQPQIGLSSHRSLPKSMSSLEIASPKQSTRSSSHNALVSYMRRVSDAAAGPSHTRPYAEGSVIAKGPATIIKQEGSQPAAYAQIKPGVGGKLDSIHKNFVMTGGTVGHGRPASPGRDKGALAAYGKGEFIKVKMDLSNGGTGFIEDRGGSSLGYKEQTFQKDVIPPGGKIEKSFSAKPGSNSLAHVKAYVEEPASVGVEAHTGAAALLANQ